MVQIRLLVVEVEVAEAVATIGATAEAVATMAASAATAVKKAGTGSRIL